MFRKIILIAALALSAGRPVAAAGEDPNVLSYYAVTNSLDGQPMVDMTNVLRFYPVYAVRDSVDRVVVTIYYGGNVFTRSADRTDGGRYWQVLLPVFRLGEAIQRIEVQEHFRLDNYYVGQFRYLLLTLKYENDSLAAQNRSDMDEARKTKKKNRERLRMLDGKLDSLGVPSPVVSLLRKSLDASEEKYKTVRDSIINKLSSGTPDLSVKPFLQNNYRISLDTASVNAIRRFGKKLAADSPHSASDSLDALIYDYRDAGASFIGSAHTYRSMVQNQSSTGRDYDSLVEQLKKQIGLDLADTEYSGPSVRKSDLVIDIDSGEVSGASILYRNYKEELRYMPALDPAEKMGIFRVRYVPFPVAGLPSNRTMSLHGPFGEKFTVFEIGLSFGDAVVPGDEFVVPEFSFKRLGVAFGITEKLFSDSAEVMALALTYDFNSYGSIGLGGNFAQHEVHPYFSLGINKKAFEALIGGLAGLFK